MGLPVLLVQLEKAPARARSNFSRHVSCPLLHFPLSFSGYRAYRASHQGTVLHMGFERLQATALFIIHLFHYNPGVLCESVPRGRVSSVWLLRARALSSFSPVHEPSTFYCRKHPAPALFFKPREKDWLEVCPLVQKSLKAGCEMRNE